MPPRKPADVWEAADMPTPTHTEPEPKPEPEPEPTVENIPAQPPGPIHLELRINNRNQLVQRVYSYTIDQTNPNTVVITGQLTPTGARND
jgi:hypothetical protein